MNRSPPRRKSRIRYSFPSVWNAEGENEEGGQGEEGGRGGRDESTRLKTIKRREAKGQGIEVLVVRELIYSSSSLNASSVTGTEPITL